jgi:hypothetical protein
MSDDTYANHVLLGNALSDGNDQGDLGLNGLQDGTGSHGRRDIDDGSIGLDLTGCIGDSVEDGETQVSLTTLLGGDTSNHVGAVLNGLLGVESTLLLFQERKGKIVEYVRSRSRGQFLPHKECHFQMEIVLSYEENLIHVSTKDGMRGKPGVEVIRKATTDRCDRSNNIKVSSV